MARHCDPRSLARLLLLATVVSSIPLAGDVRWVTDVQRGREEGLARHQPILLDFWASWCGPCSAMDTEVFSQERVAAAMTKVVPVRVDIDRHNDLARRYRVEATPTIIVTDGLGNELFRHRGMLTADQLVGVMEALPSDLTTINTLATAISRNGDDTGALKSLGDELRRHQLYVASSEYYRRGLRTRAGRARGEPRAAMLLALGRNEAMLRAFDQAQKTLSQLLREFPEHPEADGIRREIAAARAAR